MSTLCKLKQYIEVKFVFCTSPYRVKSKNFLYSYPVSSMYLKPIRVQQPSGFFLIRIPCWCMFLAVQGLLPFCCLRRLPFWSGFFILISYFTNIFRTCSSGAIKQLLPDKLRCCVIAAIS